jgi:hypothetical protein
VVDIHNGVLLRQQQEWSHVVSWKLDRTGDHHLTQNKPVLQSQVSHVFSHLWKLGKNKIKQNQGHEN